MKQLSIVKEIKKISFIFNIVILLILIIAILSNIRILNNNIKKKLEQQAELAMLNINKINTNSEFLITYLSNIISINDNYNNKIKMQKILSSITNTQSIKSVVIWIDNQNRLFHNQNNISTHYIKDLTEIIPIKDLNLNAYNSQINPNIIDDIRFYHEKIFSIITYLQKNKKPVGYLIIGFSLSNLLNKLNLVPNKYNIDIALLDMNQDVHTINSNEPILYENFNKKNYKNLRLLKHIDNSSFFFIINYDKRSYWIKLIKLILFDIFIFTFIFIFNTIYTKLLIHKLVIPINEIHEYIIDKKKKLPQYSIYEINIIKQYIIDNLQNYQLLQETKNELHDYKIKLNYTYKIKSEFTSRVSHEIKTPLNIIVLYSEIIKNEMFGKIENKKYKEYASHIYNSGQNLMLMTEDLLLLNEIENNKIDLTQTISVQINQLIEEILENLKEYIKTKKTTIDKQIDSNLPMLVLDYQKTKRAIHHIVHNAIKFSQEQYSTIIIRCKIKTINFQKYISITILNKGIEIDHKKITHISLPFYQLDSGIDRKFDGLGIGLTIAKKLIEMQGGEFKITNENSITVVTINFLVN